MTVCTTSSSFFEKNSQVQEQCIESSMHYISHYVLFLFQEFLQHARVASSWMRHNKQLFKGSVFEPTILRQSDAEIISQVQRQISFGLTFIDLRDNLLFDFTDIDDVNAFTNEVREGMDCAAHFCLNGQQYLENNLQP